MTAPDEFPAKGEWSVNRRLATGHYFLTESEGEGVGHIVPHNLYPYPSREVIDASAIGAFLEQICARHNEGIREDNRPPP